MCPPPPLGSHHQRAAPAPCGILVACTSVTCCRLSDVLLEHAADCTSAQCLTPLVVQPPTLMSDTTVVRCRARSPPAMAPCPTTPAPALQAPTSPAGTPGAPLSAARTLHRVWPRNCQLDSHACPPARAAHVGLRQAGSACAPGRPISWLAVRASSTACCVQLMAAALRRYRFMQPLMSTTPFVPQHGARVAH